MVTRADIRRAIAATLAGKGVETPDLDAVLLLAYAESVSVDDIRLHGEKEVVNTDLLNACVARRAAHEPVAKITGQKGFWKSDFYVTRDVLDPRPDSETLIDAVLGLFVDRRAPLSVLDLGTGSGCLALSVLGEFPQATAVGVDISEKALSVAVENACRLGFENRFTIQKADWGETDFCRLFPSPFDVVVCNPPYIADTEPLSADTLFDPKEALFASENGLGDYRLLSEKLPFLLKEDGYAFFEVGMHQASAVSALFAGKGIETSAVKKDFGGVERCLVLSVTKKSG